MWNPVFLKCIGPKRKHLGPYGSGALHLHLSVPSGELLMQRDKLLQGTLWSATGKITSAAGSLSTFEILGKITPADIPEIQWLSEQR